jgi:hypothetical protein
MKHITLIAISNAIANNIYVITLAIFKEFYLKILQ